MIRTRTTSQQKKPEAMQSRLRQNLNLAFWHSCKKILNQSFPWGEGSAPQDFETRFCGKNDIAYVPHLQINPVFDVLRQIAQFMWKLTRMQAESMLVLHHCFYSEPEGGNPQKSRFSTGQGKLYIVFGCRKQFIHKI